MPIKLPTILGAALFLIGAGITIILPALGIPMAAAGFLFLLWWLIGYISCKFLKKRLSKRLIVNFKKADFQSIGMSSPYVDFYFNIHSCISRSLALTGQKSGELWNPCIEPWHADWLIDTKYNNLLKPDFDNEIRIRWFVPLGNRGPMAEFAFSAVDSPPEQMLTFEDMKLALKGRVFALESDVGWLQLSNTVNVKVPDHPVFDRVRRDYIQWQHPEDQNKPN
jgi:hypothetical protein